MCYFESRVTCKLYLLVDEFHFRSTSSLAKRLRWWIGSPRGLIQDLMGGGDAKIKRPLRPFFRLARHENSTTKQSLQSECVFWVQFHYTYTHDALSRCTTKLRRPLAVPALPSRGVFSRCQTANVFSLWGKNSFPHFSSFSLIPAVNIDLIPFRSAS